MGRKTLTTEQLTTVSEVASEIHKYERIFTEQTTIMQKDPEALRAAHARVSQNATLEYPPESNANHEDYEKWRAAMEAQCQVEPSDFDDRIRIASAAMALSSSNINANKHPEHVNAAIQIERTRLERSWQNSLRDQEATNAFNPSSNLLSYSPPSRQDPSPQLAPLDLTWDEIESGTITPQPINDCIPGYEQNLSLLVDHVFEYLDYGSEDEELFRVVDCVTSAKNGTTFEIQFEGCGDETIMISQSEMLDKASRSKICWKTS